MKNGNIASSSTYHLNRMLQIHLDDYPKKIPNDLKNKSDWGGSILYILFYNILIPYYIWLICVLDFHKDTSRLRVSI